MKTKSQIRQLTIAQSGYESFAKPITKLGLLRVILYYLNPIIPLKNEGFTVL
jgi:hypothetical protein